MKRSTILFFATVLALISLVGRSGSTLAHAGTDYCLDDDTAAFLVLINDYRQQNNLGPLIASHDLGAAAEHHSQDMADQNYFSHTGQNGSSPKDRLTDHGYTFDTYWGENISAGRETAQEAFDGWKASPGHNANMLSPNFVAIGISRADNPASEFEFYWTTVFGGVADEAAVACEDGAGGGNGQGNGNGNGQGNGNGAGQGNGNGQGNMGGGNDEEYCLGEEEAAFLVLINDYRQANNLPLLVASQDLGAAAKFHSEDMANEDYLSHEGQNGSTPEERILAAGYTDEYVAENIAGGQDTAQDVFDEWKASAAHNRNMTDPDFAAIGIGRAQNPDSEYEFYWTTVFGGVADEAAVACEDGAGGGNGQGNGTGTGGDDQADGDGDGLFDTDETDVYGTDPEEADTDGDGSSDGDEVFYGTDPTDADDAPDDTNLSDTDEDGLYDADETGVYGTDPNESDTDGDGASDGDEVFFGTDPLDDTSSPDDEADRADSDEDGLFDDDETGIYGTDPDNEDTDGDGSTDGEEIFNGTDPLDDAA